MTPACRRAGMKPAKKYLTILSIYLFGQQIVLLFKPFHKGIISMIR
jgi:hypothetical protein